MEIVAYIKIAVLAIGLLYFMYRAGVAADAGNTADVIFRFWKLQFPFSNF